MKIQILGTGCPSCMQTEVITRQAIKNLGLDVEIEKITDINKIIDFGVMTTPALAVDGEVKFSGEIPSVKGIEEILK